jgi:hypothetical protein
VPVNRIARLYHPDTKDYLLTNNNFEVCLATSYGYIWDGVSFIDPGYQAGVTTPIYRISKAGKHIYTSSLAIRDQHINDLGFSDEGILFYGYINPDPAQKIVPVYHMGNSSTNIFVVNEGEKLLNESYLGISTFGIAFFTKSSEDIYPQKNVYRQASWVRGRLYTLSEAEKNNSLYFGFRDELSSFSSAEISTFNTTPIYRLRSPSGTYFYTNSRPERDIAVINHNYISEGIGFYGRVMPINGSKPVYRLTNYTNGHRLYTNSEVEKNNAINLYGYSDEGIGWFEN